MEPKKQYEKLIRDELRSLGCGKQFTEQQPKNIDRRGSTTPGCKDYELLLLSNMFYSIVHRLFKMKPRQVVRYQGFDEKGNSAGIANLENKIIKGESLIPHLSKNIFEIDQARKNDPMLNEWSIYHFHIPPVDGGGLFVNRTKDLLFSIVTDDHFIFLDIKPHPDKSGTYNPWVDVGIIEKIEEFYPELLEQYYVGEGRLPFKLTTEQLENLRKANGSTNIITASGKEYEPPGFGSFADGLPVSSVCQSDVAMALIESLAGDTAVKLAFDDNYNLVSRGKLL